MGCVSEVVEYWDLEVLSSASALLFYDTTSEGRNCSREPEEIYQPGTVLVLPFQLAKSDGHLGSTLYIFNQLG